MEGEEARERGGIELFMLAQNMQKMHYALQDTEIPIYERDEEGNIIYYEDEDGNKIPLETGETEIGYGKPVEFFGNISMSGSEAEAREYGLDLSQYSAVLVTSKGMLPLTETSRIWHNTEPVVDENGYADEFSADYTVVKLSPSLNVDKYVLKAVVK